MAGFMISTIFWGALLILWGILIILNGVFHINIPSFRVIIAFVFVYIGIMVLTGGFKQFSVKSDNQSVIFGESRMQADIKENNQYNIIFGKGTVDLSAISLSEGKGDIEVNTIFGESVIEISPNIPALLTVNAVFGSASLPDNTITSFGTYTYKTENFNDKEGYLPVKANTIFGSTRVVIKK